MASTASIYTRVAASRIRAHFQYRLSFVLQVIGSFFLSFLDFVAILVIFHHLPHLAGWSLGEVAFLYGSSAVMFKLSDILMTNMDRLPVFIRMGSFDQVLTRPLGTLGQVMTGDLDIRHVGSMTQGALVLWIGVNRVAIDWTPERVIVFVAMLIGALVIFCSLYVATNAVAFWTMDAREVANSFTYGGNFMTQFPMHIYGAWMRRIFAYVIPLGFVNYFPSLYLLGKTDPAGSPPILRFMSPAVALGLAFIAGSVWRSAVRHYRSTGS
ncbi:MAG: ABC-2 family transporter protein [Actinomycetota bacterium]